MSKYKKWTAEEVEFIKNNHHMLKDEDLAAKLSEQFNSNITTSMVRRQRRKLNLEKKRGRPAKVSAKISEPVSSEPTVA